MFEIVKEPKEDGDMDSGELSKELGLPLREINVAIFSPNYEGYLKRRQRDNVYEQEIHPPRTHRDGRARPHRIHAARLPGASNSYARGFEESGDCGGVGGYPLTARCLLTCSPKYAK